MASGWSTIPGMLGNEYPPLQPSIVKGKSKMEGPERKGSLLSPVSPITSTFSFPYPPQKRSSQAFYELVATQPTLDHSSFTRIHKLLLRDPSSISGILKEEATRESFILGFQEQASSIVAFYNRLGPYFTKSLSQNVTLAESLLEGLLLPLFTDEYQNIFIHDEMLQLITVSLQSYYACSTFSSPGLVAQLVKKLTMFPETRLLERFIANFESGKLFVTIIGDPKFGTSLFEHGHETLLTWIERLIQLSNCGFDHGIAEPVRKWRTINTLRSTYAQTTASTPGPEWIVSPNMQMIFQEFGVNTPKTLGAARNTVHRLELREAFGIFEAIAQSFPCSNCCEAPVKDSRQIMHQNIVNDCRELYPELEEIYTDGRQFYRAELKNLGRWRIVLSKLALKDLSNARTSGQFAAVERKLRELATGNWDRRKSLTKKHINPDWRIPIRKAVYNDNGNIIWHIYLSFNEMENNATQVILVWRICDNKELLQSEAVIIQFQKTFRKEFIEACKIRLKDRTIGGFEPQTFVTELLEPESTPEPQEQRLNPPNTVISRKFYTLTQKVLDGILASGANAEFPFDIAHDEVDIIRQTSSASFTLGRSGTGKTTCLVFKLLWNYIGSRVVGDRFLSADSKPIRQVFITRSEILVAQLKGQIRRLVNCQLGLFDSDMDSTGSEAPKENDEDVGACDLWSLKEEDFPLVCTFDKFLSLVETSLKKCSRNHWGASEPSGVKMHRRGRSVVEVPTRRSREVEAQTFIRDYWSRFPASIKQGIQVDLVFSEIMGIIKGSTSILPGRNLRALTREEYLNKSCRVAPLFTSETERGQVYTIYEHYEKLKRKYQDWDGVDRTREIFIQLQGNPGVATKLKEVVEEVYVDEIQDQRLLEIEFLFTLVTYPQGVHLAGDSAQCISRDSTFRFSDIKALFYDVFLQKATAMNNSSLAKPKLFKLAHNYRSHQGIIALGALLIDNLYEGFPDMIDKLKPEIGMYPGPKPIFFAGFKPEDVLMSHSSEDTPDQLEDFGTDQVIIVRDEDTQKEIHSRIRSKVLMLTVLESKGMEFEHVVLLNFFSSSRHGPHYKDLGKLIDKQRKFDSKKHSVLCAELKALYVAVTRCQTNLSIMEENQSIAELIVKCWTEKVPQPLIDAVHPYDKDARKRIEELRSWSSRNPELWLKNGQQLMEKKLYKKALFCFEKTSNEQWQTYARAYIKRQEAEALIHEKTDHEKLRNLYRESAKLFLNITHPLEASRSFEAAGLFEEAANMWVDQGRPDKAAPLYERAGEYITASKTYHSAAMYTEATNSLRTGKHYEELVKYLGTVKNNLDPFQYQRLSKLCNLLAHQGKLEKSKTLMLLGSDLKIEMFYRQRGYTDNLLDFFLSRDRLKDAFDYLTSIGEVKKAVLLAPSEEMEANIPPRELDRVQQLLLISDLRNPEGTRPEYADPAHRLARPGMDKLWDALYGDLMFKTLVTDANIDQQMGDDIDSFASIQRYLDIIVLERMDEIVPRASEIEKLPIASVNYGLSLLKELHYAKEEVPGTLRQFIGADQQLNRRSLILISSSLMKPNGKFNRRISQHEFLKFSQEWFANLVVEAAFSFLDAARDMWFSMRPGNYCIHFAAAGKPYKGLYDTSQICRPGCTYAHSIMSPKDFKKLCSIIHKLAFITTQLRFFYTTLRGVIKEDLQKEFRGKQRKWLELMFMELTYISAVQQDPREIHDTPLSHTHEDEFRSYNWLRSDLDRLLVDKHVKEEWDTRSTFSELLELTQRSWKIGSRTARTVRILIEDRIDSPRGQHLSPAQMTGFEIFRGRPSTNRGYRGNYDLPKLRTYLLDLTRLHSSQLRVFHAVICEYERIATYLLLLEGDESGFFILTSWISIYIPEVGTAYRTSHHSHGATIQQGSPTNMKQEIRDCLLRLVHSLLYLTHDLFSPGNRISFRFGGLRGRPVPKELLLKRCLDIIWICLINIQAGFHGFDSQPLIMQLKQIIPWLGTSLEIHLPSYLTNEAFLKILNDSFRVYAGKESITFVKTLANVPRFAKYRAVIKECLIPEVLFAEIDLKMRGDISQLNPNTQDQSEQIFSFEQVRAAQVICRIWRVYWPRYKKAKEWKSTSIGQSTIAINELCESYRPELRGVPEIVEDLYMIFWGQGPKTHEAITAAETQRLETAECYQQFFTTLRGTTYTAEDLERVEESFEEVEGYTKKIAEMKKIFSLQGMRELWSQYQSRGTADLNEYMVAMQRKAAGIKDALIQLATEIDSLSEIDSL